VRRLELSQNPTLPRRKLFCRRKNLFKKLPSGAGFLSKEFPNVASEIIKARSFLVARTIFAVFETVQLLLIVSDYSFETFHFKNWPIGGQSFKHGASQCVFNQAFGHMTAPGY
jgi:hypothetical protein